MQTGKLYINEKDVYTEYGIFLCSDRAGVYDNLSALLTPPSIKPYTVVKYREREGEEVDLKSPCFEARDVSLRFALIADSEIDFSDKYGRFIDLLKSGWLEIVVTEIGKAYRMYYASCPGIVMKTRLKTTGRIACVWTVKLREPKPNF